MAIVNLCWAIDCLMAWQLLPPGEVDRALGAECREVHYGTLSLS